MGAQYWYELITDKVTLLWDSWIITDRHILCNKPEIVIRGKDTGKCLIIDMTIPIDYNIQKATENINNMWISRLSAKMWNKTVEGIPVIIVATGLVEKSLKKYLDKRIGHQNIYNFHETNNPWKSLYIMQCTVHQARLSGTRHLNHVNSRCMVYTQ